MNLERQSLSEETSALDLNDLIIDAIRDIKGKRIKRLNLRDLEEAPATDFIICEGDSTVQVRSIADNIQKRVRDQLRLYPNHVEGIGHSKWVLVDYFSTVVHIFYPETREFYDLEDLWSDAHVTDYESL